MVKRERVLRWGLLSTARINRALIDPLRASARNELVAVASRTQAGAEAYARAWDIPRAFGSYEAMLADPEIDVVYISLPNSLHAEWTVRAAQAGKHVLCEKPLAMSVEEVDAMAAAARENGVVVTEGFMYRHRPQTLKVRELAASGAIGQVQLVSGSFTFNLTRPGDVRLDPALGGGSIWDVGCYPISYARYVIGAEPIEAFGWQVLGPTGVDVVFVGQLRFPGDIYAQFDCGFRAPLRVRMEVVGTEGAIVVPEPFKPQEREGFRIVRSEENVETVSMAGDASYAGEVEDMADALLEGRPPRVSLVDSRGTIAAIVALLRSAREGRPVPVAA